MLMVSSALQLGHSMDSFFNMVDVQTILFIYLAIGFFCCKRGIFTNEVRDKLTDFVVFITLPCMIFESFNMTFSLEALEQGAVAYLGTPREMLLGPFDYNAVQIVETERRGTTWRPCAPTGRETGVCASTTGTACFRTAGTPVEENPP